jgi:hypothetical protein
MRRGILLGLCVLGAVLWSAAGLAQQPYENAVPNKFEQLYQETRTPNIYRTASGAPGHGYWQNRADYEMQIELDDEHQRLYGTETITYHNNSPDELTYLWVQLDQNMQAPDSDTRKIATGSMSSRMSFGALRQLYYDFDGGYKIEWVRDRQGQDLKHTVNRTMMRVDLPAPLKPKTSFSFSVKWWYNINDRIRLGGRSGYEYFPEDGNYLYAVAQFFPRMAVYNEVEGWQHKQFLGAGEFTLPFGNYRVSLTAPADHVVAATGVLQNPREVLTPVQQQRLALARTAAEPVAIVTAEEARAAEKGHAMSRKTWIFHADNVRDFGFASSRKFIWDAMGVKSGPNDVMAMSFYPKEGNPLWERYATRVVAHTLNVYSRYTFYYPYPVAIAIHTDRIGMEYPMICFNGGRPEKDGTYSDRTKYGMISVIIHEVGHNYFPMIVNSDERQWTWMDEGLNTFLQFLTEQEWERDYPSRRGPAHQIADYMKGDKRFLSPIMTNSESVFQLGNNAYAKTATGLNILRETIMGRELFDYAFRTYARRWMFRHPTPEDFFRSMEDASAVDLDWFWRGWFYGNEPVDIALKEVKWFQIDTRNPEVEKKVARMQKEEANPGITALRNREQMAQTLLDRDPSLADFYNRYDPFDVSILDKEEYERYLAQLGEEERQFLEETHHYYEITFQNIGGMVMPLILEFAYEDSTREVKRIPAEIWRLRSDEVTKVFVTDKPVKRITLDPFLETADTNLDNNYWPPQAKPTRFQLFKERQEGTENPMQRQKRMEEREKAKKEVGTRE